MANPSESGSQRLVQRAVLISLTSPALRHAERHLDVRVRFPWDCSEVVVGLRRLDHERDHEWAPWEARVPGTASKGVQAGHAVQSVFRDLTRMAPCAPTVDSPTRLLLDHRRQVVIVMRSGSCVLTLLIGPMWGDSTWVF